MDKEAEYLLRSYYRLIISTTNTVTECADALGIDEQRMIEEICKVEPTFKNDLISLEKNGFV